MANLVEQINSIEAMTEAKEDEYAAIIKQLEEKFENTKRELEAASADEFAQFKSKLQADKESQFQEIETNYRKSNQEEIEAIETDIQNRRTELAQKIAKKVVEQIWQ